MSNGNEYGASNRTFIAADNDIMYLRGLRDAQFEALKSLQSTIEQQAKEIALLTATIERQKAELEAAKSELRKSSIGWHETSMFSAECLKKIDVLRQAKEIESPRAELEAEKGRTQRQEDALFDCRTRHEFALERIDVLEAELAALKQTNEPVGYVEREQIERWMALRGTKFESAARCYLPFSILPYKSDLSNCDLPLYLAAQHEGDKHES